MKQEISKSKERSFFSKAEKLKSKKLIDILFKEGKVIRKNLMNCLYLNPDEVIDSPVQVMISVPKKLFKKATDRNLIKRRIREAYRLNKKSLIHLCRNENKPLILAFLFKNSAIKDYSSIETDIQNIIADLTNKVSKK